MDALLLFSHGSLLCGAGEALDAHAERLRRRGDFALVAIGYLNYSEPPFQQTVGELVAAGATRIVVMPYFLVAGYFVTSSLPKCLDEARARHPNTEFVAGDALRHDAGLTDALLDAADTARPASHWRDPLKRAAASCRPAPQCPLYATPACPKVPSPEAAALPREKVAA